MKVIPRIETFRAIAALSVVHLHYFVPLLPVWLWFDPLGVQFFFVLSGFLITTFLLRDIDSGISPGNILKSFYIRRIFRICPLYYVVLLAGMWVGYAGFRESFPWTATFTTNYMYCHGLSDAGYFGPSWTIAVEEQFYLILPLALLSFSRKLSFAVAVGLIVPAVAYRWAVQFGALPPLCAMSTIPSSDHLCIGVLAAMAGHHFGLRRAERALKKVNWITLPCFLAGCMPTVFPAWMVPYVLTVGVTLGSVFSAWLIVGAAADGPSASSWGGRWLPFLGSISYAIYLIHNPMLAVVWPLERGVPALSPRLLALSLTIVSAVLVRFCLEKPMIRLGRRLAAMPARGRADYPGQARSSL